MSKVIDPVLKEAQFDGQPCIVLSADLDQESFRFDTMGGTRPDPAWQYADDKAHIHRWYGQDLPTLDIIEHETEDDFFLDYECRWCEEVIVPGTLSTPPESGWRQGSTTFTAELSGKLSLDLGDNRNRQDLGHLLTTREFAVNVRWVSTVGYPDNPRTTVIGVREPWMREK